MCAGAGDVYATADKYNEMRKRRLFSVGQIFADWTLISYLGGGGNGEVWACQNSKGEKYAIKLLKKIRPVPYSRFKDETNVIERNSDIIGLMPLIEKHLPEKLNGDTPFYIMPIAERSEVKLRDSSIEDKIDAILQVAETLALLHERKIYHRDIKPANILFLNSRFTLADFGLVDYPEKGDVSLKDEEIGPKWTMAPEMRRESSSSDAAKADVYSLAKTLWIFLTNRKKGFDGQYSTESIIDLKKFYPSSYTSPIDNLLISSTDNDPERRPTIPEFIEALKKWQTLAKDFHQRNQQQWFEIQTKLFPTSIPERVIWEDINDIVKVLKVVCAFSSLNHVFFPVSGGLDLKDVRLSYEEECIELDFIQNYIVKPKRLLFESFGFNTEWNYFRLETYELEPSRINEIDEIDDENPFSKASYKEEISELSPGQYFPFHILEYRRDNEEDYLFTEFSRFIVRWFRGSFVIFCKRSVYNLTSSTYDGRHNRMTTDEFREYIQSNVDDYKKQSQSPFTKETPGNDNRRRVPSEKVKHYIEEDTVYRCGWCGNIVDIDGSELDYHMRKYYFKVHKKFGESIVKKVNGYCCKDKWQ